MEENNVNVEQMETQPQNEVKEAKAEKTFTQEEVNDIVEKRLKRERNKIEERIEKERNEAERLASLSAEERKQEELRLQQEKYETQLKEFEEMKRQFEYEQMLSQTTKELNNKDLPIEFAEYLVDMDAEKTKVNIDNFEKAWTEAIQRAVDSRLKSSSTSPTVPLVEKTVKDVKDMTFAEFREYSKNN